MPDRRLLADRYRLGELLGTGGVAEVRRARDLVLARDVAVKLFRHSQDDADARRFDNEIRTLATLSHPGLVTVYDAGTTGETPFMVLELVEGHTLRDRIAHGPMDVDEVRRLGAALADALAHVHAHGFIHRDVKPANILLDDEAVPRLADFGLARLVDGARVTRADQVVGTAAYLAPEQVRGGKITSAVDVYALGLVLLECLTGHREYEGPELEAAVARLHRAPVIPDDLPFDLVRLLSLMTSLTPARRPSARKCAAALRAANPPTRVLTRPGRSRGVLVAASVAVVLAAAGTGLVVQNRTTPAESTPPVTTTEPSPGQPVVEQPVVDQPLVDQPLVDQPLVEDTVLRQPAQPDRKDNSGKGKSGKGKGKP